MKTNDSKPATLGDLFREYHYTQNPVTKSVLMKCISERLDELEKNNGKCLTVN